MKYLCLVYAAEEKLAALSEPDREALVEEFATMREDLRRSGHFLAAERLSPVASATTVRVHEGRLSVTDGAFAETREQLGGFLLIEARDLNDAIRVASTIPAARLGSVEVRPIREALLFGAGNHP